MSLKIGIVGLPNVGKSTLFNALTKTAKAQVGSFPFTTIEPNVGRVAVPDERLPKLAKTLKSEKIIPASVEFVDIAGLVKGAHKGEGLGNQFLGHIREADAIAIVIRRFTSENVSRMGGTLNPKDEYQTILLELILADLQTLAKYWNHAAEEQKRGENVQALIGALEKIEVKLEAEELASAAQLSDNEITVLKPYPLITLKSMITIENVDEKDAGGAPHFVNGILLSAKMEMELASLNEEEQREYLAAAGLQNSGLERLISIAYRTLGFETFFTASEKEARAWQFTKAARAPQAAGLIHTDFERGFIKAEVIAWDRLVAAGGWTEARAKGWARAEGKEYIVQDGDVCLFKFNV